MKFVFFMGVKFMWVDNGPVPLHRSNIQLMGKFVRSGVATLYRFILFSFLPFGVLFTHSANVHLG